MQGQVVDKHLMKAYDYFRLAADQGFAPAQSNLGVMYQHGLGVDKDNVEACKLYRAAADQGNAPTQSNLGSCTATV